MTGGRPGPVVVPQPVAQDEPVEWQAVREIVEAHVERKVVHQGEGEHAEEGRGGTNGVQHIAQGDWQ